MKNTIELLKTLDNLRGGVSTRVSAVMEVYVASGVTINDLLDLALTEQGLKNRGKQNQKVHDALRHAGINE